MESRAAYTHPKNTQVPPPPRATKSFKRAGSLNKRVIKPFELLTNGKTLVYVFPWKVTAPNIHSSLLTFSLSIRRLWAGKRRKMEAKKGESSPSPLPHLKSPLPIPLERPHTQASYYFYFFKCRLKKHYSSYEPTLQTLKHKYEVRQ